MTASHTKAIEALEALAHLVREQADVSRLARLTKAMISIVDDGGQESILPIWAICASLDDADVRRSFSYIFARYASSLEDIRWVPLLWLVSSPASSDESSIINTLTALQQHPSIGGIAQTALRQQVGLFLLRAAHFSDITLEAAAEVIASYAREDALVGVLSEPDVARLVARFREVSVEDDDKASIATEAIEALLAHTYVEQFPPAAIALRAWVIATGPAPVENDWAKVVSRAEEIARGYVAHYAEFDELAQCAAESHAAAFDLRIGGRWADSGLLPFDFFQKLLFSWRRVYSTIREGLAALLAGPQFFVLAPTHGSFVARVLVVPANDQPELEGEVATALTTKLGSIVSDDTTMTSAERNEFAPLLSLVAEHGVTLDLGAVSDRAHRVRERVFITPNRARRIVEGIAPAPSTPTAQPVEVLGTLDAANHRSGQFEILPADGSDRIKGSILAGGRNVLLNRVIGQLYSFELVREGSGDSARWTLLKLRRQGQSAAEQDDIGEPRWPALGAAVRSAEPTVDFEVTGGAEVRPNRKHRDFVLPTKISDAAIGISRLSRDLTSVESLPELPSEISSELVPQVDNLTRIVDVVRILASRRELSEETLGIAQRHVDYAKQAARALNLLTETGELTKAGTAMARLPPGRVVTFLVGQFETSIFGRAWIAWSGATGVKDLNPETAWDFLRKRAGWTREGMIKRRGRTLRRWAVDLKSGVLQPIRGRGV